MGVVKDITKDEMKIISRIAKDMTYKWRAVEYDDLVQEMYVHFFKEYKHMSAYRGEGTRGRQTFAKSMARAAITYAKRTQAQANGVHSLAEQTSGWTRKQLAGALPYIWETPEGLGAISSSPQTPERVTAYRNGVSHVGLTTDVFSKAEEASLLIYSIREALPRLTARQQQVLELKYRDGLKHREIATVIGSKEVNVGMAAHRALTALHEKVATI